MQNSKKELRRALLAARLLIDKEEKRTLDAALCAALAAHPLFVAANSVLGYLPMRGEPDLTPLFALAEELGKRVFLPRCDKDGMTFHLFEGWEGLSPDRFAIPAPAPTAPVLTDTQNALCLLPGLAADKSGFRLGYGGGFYDRFLPRFAGSLIFPVYARFVLDTLPSEAHDQRIPHIVTEKGECL